MRDEEREVRQIKNNSKKNLMKCICNCIQGNYSQFAGNRVDWRYDGFLEISTELKNMSLQ